MRRTLLACFRLEDRLAPATNITPLEQYALELLNRDRADPAAAAVRYGVDLNEGIAPGTITTAAKQPLAPNQSLLNAIRGHLADLAATNTFSHTGSNGSTLGQRTTAAGFSGSVGENLYVSWPSSPTTEAYADNAIRSLYIDRNVTGRGHRTNMMNAGWQVIGNGFSANGSPDFNGYFGQNFGNPTGTAVFLTGVIYNDLNANQFYNVNEVVTGVTVRAVETTTNAVVEDTVSPGGSFGFTLPAGTYRIEVTGSGIAGGTRVMVGSVTVGTQNLKVDFLTNRNQFKVGTSFLDATVPSTGGSGGTGGGTTGGGTGGGGTGTGGSAGGTGVRVGSPPTGFAVGAGVGGRVRTFDGAGTPKLDVPAVGGFTGGVRVASADFNRDGVLDVVVGTGPGAPTQVRVLDGKSGAELFSTRPFEPSFTGGVYVAAGDVTGDGVADFVVTPDEGGGPRVLVFSGADFANVADFMGIDDPNFRGGARPAIGDLDGDGFADLVIGAGFGGGTVAGTFGQSRPTRMMGDFYIFEETLRNGAFVAIGDVNGDGFADLIGGGGPGGGPRVFVLDGKEMMAGRQTVLADFFGGDPDSRGGIRVAVVNLDGDAKADLVVGAGDGAGSRVTAYPGATLAEAFRFDAFPDLAGVYVG